MPNNPFGISMARQSPYQLRRTPWHQGGKMAPGSSLEVSYDFLPGTADEGGHSHPSCFLEPRYIDIMAAAINDTVRLFRPHAIMFDHDEIRGINRDSRSLRAGLTNAQLLAAGMNEVANSCKRASIEHGVPVSPVFWDDMVRILRPPLSIYHRLDPRFLFYGDVSVPMCILPYSIAVKYWECHDAK